MHHMASRGWLCVSIDYRLSPHATFPDHLVDCKRAIRWIRESVHEYGGDPNFVIATGGSAGGHLCALVGLTANRPEFQPGFEAVDTAVRACVPFYGVYDLVNLETAYPNDGLRRVLERQVLKAAPHEQPEAYRRASPLEHVHQDAPPFFVLHGDADSLVPVEVARRFVSRAPGQEPRAGSLRRDRGRAARLRAAQFAPHALHGHGRRALLRVGARPG